MLGNTRCTAKTKTAALDVRWNNRTNKLKPPIKSWLQKEAFSYRTRGVQCVDHRQQRIKPSFCCVGYSIPRCGRFLVWHTKPIPTCVLNILELSGRVASLVRRIRHGSKGYLPIKFVYYCTLVNTRISACIPYRTQPWIRAKFTWQNCRPPRIRCWPLRRNNMW